MRSRSFTIALAGLVGGMKVFTVGPDEMRTLAQGRIKLQPGTEPAGMYDPVSGHIAVLDDAMRNPAEAAPHCPRGLHGALMHIINGSTAARGVIDHRRLTAAARHLERGGAAADHYGLSTPHEFISEAMSNPAFQRFLATLPADDRLVRAFGLPRGGARTLWDAFTAAVRKMLAIPAEQHTYLDAAIKLTDRLFDMAETQRRLPRAGPAMAPSASAPRPASSIEAMLKSVPPSAIKGHPTSPGLLGLLAGR